MFRCRFSSFSLLEVFAIAIWNVFFEFFFSTFRFHCSTWKQLFHANSQLSTWGVKISVNLKRSSKSTWRISRLVSSHDLCLVCLPLNCLTSNWFANSRTTLNVFFSLQCWFLKNSRSASGVSWPFCLPPYLKILHIFRSVKFTISNDRATMLVFFSWLCLFKWRFFHSSPAPSPSRISK